MGACTRHDKLALVTAMCVNGSLYHQIHTKRTSFSIFHLVQFADQIAQGMAYLHARGLLHRDLKSKNILLNEKMEVKIADFGLACVRRDHARQSGLMGSVYWMAPELFKGKQNDEKSDVYAYLFCSVS